MITCAGLYVSLQIQGWFVVELGAVQGHSYLTRFDRSQISSETLKASKEQPKEHPRSPLPHLVQRQCKDLTHQSARILYYESFRCARLRSEPEKASVRFVSATRSTSLDTFSSRRRILRISAKTISMSKAYSMAPIFSPSRSAGPGKSTSKRRGKPRNTASSKSNWLLALETY